MRVTINAVSLYYEVRGKKGPVIIMLHGNGEDYTIFDRAVAYLEQKFIVYLVDSRGHGQISPVREYHYQDMVDDLAEFIRKLKLERPAICGFSDGAIVGLMFALQHPDSLSRPIACGANTRPDTFKDLKISMTRSRSLDNKDPMVRMMLTEPDITAADLARIEVPVMVVAGSRDCVKRSADFIANSVQHGQVIIIRRADHSSYVVHSIRIVDAVFIAMGVNTTDVQLIPAFES